MHTFMPLFTRAYCWFRLYRSRLNELVKLGINERKVSEIHVMFLWANERTHAQENCMVSSPDHTEIWSKDRVFAYWLFFWPFSDAKRQTHRMGRSERKSTWAVLNALRLNIVHPLEFICIFCVHTHQPILSRNAQTSNFQDEQQHNTTECWEMLSSLLSIAWIAQTWQLIYLQTGTLQMCVWSHLDFKQQKPNNVRAPVCLFKPFLCVCVWVRLILGVYADKRFSFQKRHFLQTCKQKASLLLETDHVFWRPAMLLAQVCNHFKPSTRIYRILLYVHHSTLLFIFQIVGFFSLWRWSLFLRSMLKHREIAMEKSHFNYFVCVCVCVVCRKNPQKLKRKQI